MFSSSTLFSLGSSDSVVRDSGHTRVWDLSSDHKPWSPKIYGIEVGVATRFHSTTVVTISQRGSVTTLDASRLPRDARLEYKYKETREHSVIP